MIKKIIIYLLGIVLVVFLGMILVKGLSKEDDWICQDGVWVKHGNPSAPMPTGTCGGNIVPTANLLPGGENTGIANPASKNCIEKGGSLEIITETSGQIGVCKFNDGSVCEEWRFFREECKKGQDKNADFSHAYTGTVSKEKTGYSFKVFGAQYQLRLPEKPAKELAQRLELEAKNKSEVTIIAAETPPLSRILILKSFSEK